MRRAAKRSTIKIGTDGHAWIEIENLYNSFYMIDMASRSEMMAMLGLAGSV